MGLRKTTHRLLSRLGDVLFSSVSIRFDEREGHINLRLAELERRIASLTLLLIDSAVSPQRLSHDSNLSDFGYSVFSQFGEDGILREILDRARPVVERSFVEFGVEDYREANTRLLAETGQWRGLVLDGSQENIEAIRAGQLYWKTDLTAVPTFVTAENINDVIWRAGFEGEVGVLSIDIDGNDYWVWRAIEVIDPQIVICEFNSIFGRNHAIAIPYEPEFSRSEAHHSNLYFGASLLALTHLADSKGYQLAAVEPSGVNAFFVKRSQQTGLEPLDPIEAYRCTPVRESLDRAGQMSFLSGRERLQEIRHLPVVLLPDGEQVILRDLDIEY